MKILNRQNRRFKKFLPLSLQYRIKFFALRQSSSTLLLPDWVKEPALGSRPSNLRAKIRLWSHSDQFHQSAKQDCQLLNLLHKINTLRPRPRLSHKYQPIVKSIKRLQRIILVRRVWRHQSASTSSTTTKRTRTQWTKLISKMSINWKNKPRRSPRV